MIKHFSIEVETTARSKQPSNQVLSLQCICGENENANVMIDNDKASENNYDNMTKADGLTVN